MWSVSVRYIPRVGIAESENTCTCNFTRCFYVAIHISVSSQGNSWPSWHLHWMSQGWNKLDSFQTKLSVPSLSRKVASLLSPLSLFSKRHHLPLIPLWPDTCWPSLTPPSSPTPPSIPSATAINSLSLKHKDFSLYLQSHHLFTCILHWDDLKGLLTGPTTCLLQSTLPKAARVTVLLSGFPQAQLKVKTPHHGPQGPAQSGHCWLSIDRSFPSLDCGHAAFVSDKHPTLSCLGTFTHHVSSAWNIVPHPSSSHISLSITTSERPSYLK